MAAGGPEPGAAPPPALPPLPTGASGWPGTTVIGATTGATGANASSGYAYTQGSAPGPHAGHHQGHLPPVATLGPQLQLTTGDAHRTPSTYHVNARVLRTSRAPGWGAVTPSRPLARGPAARGFAARPPRDPASPAPLWCSSPLSRSLERLGSGSLPPTDYAASFKMRQTTRPKIIGLDSRTILPPERTSSRAVRGFYPSVRRRHATSPAEMAVLPSAGGRGLLPGRRGTRRPQVQAEQPPATYAASDSGVAAYAHAPSSTGSTALGLAQSEYHVAGSMTERSAPHRTPSGSSMLSVRSPYVLEADATTSLQDPQDEIAYQTRPRMLASRENPWVYRYKVKRSMNELNKIMANKPPPEVDFSVSRGLRT